ncbi:hypothetical protein [Alteromonas macleodii]|jgi:hypothetical protein|uniref:DUF4263 domain-containing protein n=1 Tax=Alteromonas macleodii (strain English Channel 673) TaxID=1004788 RepID=A0AB32ZUI9_ALTME|nr:hypothetical protein [Alteromonas macleodii]AFT73199.1 hypothetical protein AMEC673_02490 [Alteromonas macleodii str. 'English Channel 673']MAE22106.1 hypothetical protein [Pseudomonas sp.]MBL3809295.1 hypothetical protein [Alteromonas macleodii]MBL3882832.1 hypothetical protein [Alteromonas macleodii]
MSKLASKDLTSTLAAQQSKKIEGMLTNMSHPLSVPICTKYELQKFKRGVTSVIDLETISDALDRNLPMNLPSLLLRRFWLDNETRLNDWDRQLMQNQICNSFYDVLDFIDSERPYTEVLHQSTSLDIAQALVSITTQQSAEQTLYSIQQWFGCELDILHECEPNIINQLRFARHFTIRNGERRFHISAYKKNYVVYGGWHLQKGNKPSFELIELLNSSIGYENLYLHKLQGPSKLKKAAALLKHFRRMVLKAGGNELLLTDRPEMIDFGNRIYVRDVIESRTHI